MAFRALRWSGLTSLVLLLMTIDAQAGGCGRIMEGCLGSGGDWRCRRPGMAIRARFLRGLQRLLRLRCVVAHLAFGRDLDVRGVVELHAAHRRSLHNDGGLGRLRLLGRGAGNDDDDKTSKVRLRSAWLTSSTMTPPGIGDFTLRPRRLFRRRLDSKERNKASSVTQVPLGCDKESAELAAATT